MTRDPSNSRDTVYDIPQYIDSIPLTIDKVELHLEINALFFLFFIIKKTIVLVWSGQHSPCRTK